MTALRLYSPEHADYRASITALRNLLRAGELTSTANTGGKVGDVVRVILEQVAEGGDEAAARLTSELDRAQITPQTLRVPTEVLERAHRAADPGLMGLVRRAAANVQA
jgi:histidinol dehydrogenase